MLSLLQYPATVAKVYRKQIPPKEHTSLADCLAHRCQRRILIRGKEVKSKWVMVICLEEGEGGAGRYKGLQIQRTVGYSDTSDRP